MHYPTTSTRLSRKHVLLLGWMTFMAFVWTITTRPNIHYGGNLNQMLNEGEEEEDYDNAATATAATALELDNDDDVATPQTDDATQKPWNVLFIKIPKVGGTTVAVILQRYAARFNLTIARPDPKIGQILTCGSVNSAMRSWNDLKKRSGGNFDIMATHGCFQKFMRNDVTAWKQPKRLLTLTMLRDPWSRFYSYFRFLQRCCMMDHPLEWCRRDCNWASSLEKFVGRHCSREDPNCNQMAYYLMGGTTNLSPTLSFNQALAVLKPFGFVLTSSHFNEGLAYLHLTYHIPFDVLIQIDANKNNDAPMEKPSEAVKKQSLQVMQPDSILFATANKLLSLKIAKLDPVEFHATLEKVIQARKDVKEKCTDYFGKCIRDGTDMVYGASCFHECTEAVVNGVVIPPIPQCDAHNGASYCPNGVFLKGCWSCQCAATGGRGSAKCTSVPPPQCRTIDKDALCA